MQIYSLIHAVGAGTFGYATYYEFFVLHAPRGLKRTADVVAMKKGPGKWKYLTVWNMVMQFAYHSYSLVNDIAGTNKLQKKKQSVLQRIRDVTFASWIFPVGCFVSITFWVLYSIDRELVFPKVLDKFYPSWLNHFVHTLPLVVNIVELYVTPRTYPERSVAVAGNLSFSTSYLAWVNYIAFKYGIWVYPILEVLDLFSRSVFLGSSAATILGLYFAGEKYHSWRWGAQIEEAKVEELAEDSKQR